MAISNIITGIVGTVFGLFLTGIAFVETEAWFVLFYSVPIITVSLFILLNSKEDKIEEIKTKGRKK